MENIDIMDYLYYTSEIALNITITVLAIKAILYLNNKMKPPKE